MLKINNLTKRFGGLAAVNDVSVEFAAGQINAIIGPNGAGKTTFFNLVAGAMPPTSGSIASAMSRSVTSWKAPSRFHSTTITALSNSAAYRAAALGIA